MRQPSVQPDFGEEVAQHLLKCAKQIEGQKERCTYIQESSMMVRRMMACMVTWHPELDTPRARAALALLTEAEAEDSASTASTDIVERSVLLYQGYAQQMDGRERRDFLRGILEGTNRVIASNTELDTVRARAALRLLAKEAAGIQLTPIPGPALLERR